ncbi:MAG: hypothetical protein CMM30_08470 [Rhodospirillaceae bacterium]|nr:hypothetical protein [Rhodospirillaceae bacterium]
MYKLRINLFIMTVFSYLFFTPLVSVHAHESTEGFFTFKHTWIRILPGSSNGAIYTEIINNSESQDRLIGASSSIATSLELHLHTIDDSGIARMRHVEAIDIPPKGSIKLVPGGYHIMIKGLKRPLFEEELVPVILIFEESGSTEVEAYVEEVLYKEEHDHHNH